MPAKKPKTTKRRKKTAKKPLTAAQRECAAKYVAEMVREFKKGRWKSKKQAVAVGLSKSRKC